MTCFTLQHSLSSLFLHTSPGSSKDIQSSALDVSAFSSVLHHDVAPER